MFLKNIFHSLYLIYDVTIFLAENIEPLQNYQKSQDFIKYTLNNVLCNCCVHVEFAQDFLITIVCMESVDFSFLILINMCIQSIIMWFEV